MRLTLGVANMAWQLDDREAEADLLEWLGRSCDVVALVETHDVPRLRSKVPAGWKVWRPRGDAGRRNAAVLTGPELIVGARRLSGTVKTPRRVRLRRRWIPWRHVELDGRLLRVAAYHRPPRRMRWVWPLYDRALGRWTRLGRPAAIGTDINQVRPEPVLTATGYQWAGRGIMGFLIAPQLQVRAVEKRRHPATDHQVVLVTVEWRSHVVTA